MSKVTYSLTLSLDGYVVGPDGRFDWAEPDDEAFAFATDEVRGLRAHLLGRRLYESMLYWETAEKDPAITEAELEFTRLWRALPKIVFSRTLDDVTGSNTRLATGTVAEEIAKIRDASGEGNIGIGGATLAAEVAAAGLIDEYRMRVLPVLVGGGTRYFAHDARREDLELLDTRVFSSQMIHLHYRVVR